MRRTCPATPPPAPGLAPTGVPDNVPAVAPVPRLVSRLVSLPTSRPWPRCSGRGPAGVPAYGVLVVASLLVRTCHRRVRYPRSTSPTAAACGAEPPTPREARGARRWRRALPRPLPASPRPPPLRPNDGLRRCCTPRPRRQPVWCPGRSRGPLAALLVSRRGLRGDVADDVPAGWPRLCHGLFVRVCVTVRGRVDVCVCDKLGCPSSSRRRECPRARVHA